jgi:endonuclease/exonuclease/phosphatase family metal-dependent hydrolase
MSNDRPDVRIATYNIHKCRGLDRRVNVGRIRTVLREIGADIIALQEVVWPAEAVREQHQARFLAENLGFHYRVGETRRWGKRVYGNAVLSRFPIIATHHYDLTHRRYERRGCLRVDVILPNNRIVHVFNVHLALIPRDRRSQVYKLMSGEFLSNPELRGACVVLGDFNEGPRGAATQLLRTRFQSVDILHRSRQAKTYPGIIPLFHLDHIYFDASLQVEAAQLHRSPTALIASDHAPIFAEFSFTTTAIL